MNNRDDALSVLFTLERADPLGRLRWGLFLRIAHDDGAQTRGAVRGAGAAAAEDLRVAVAGQLIAFVAHRRTQPTV